MSLLLPERIQIEFSLEDGIAGAWDEARIGALTRAIVQRELAAADADYLVSLHLVTDVSIRELNSAHRGQDVHTDVLSFPLTAPDDFIVPAGAPIHLGDVVVSYQRAAAQALEFGHSFERELGYLNAHGLLHLHGYDHAADADRERMRQREEEALQPLGFTR